MAFRCHTDPGQVLAGTGGCKGSVCPYIRVSLLGLIRIQKS